MRRGLAAYGNFGVMTLVVNHDGVIYQKDLWAEMPRIARSVKRYNPDET